MPRWRSYAETAALGELDPSRAASPPRWTSSTRSLERREWDFSAEPQRIFAADLVSSAVVLGPTPKALEAARLILDDPAASQLAKDAARMVASLRSSEEAGPSLGISEQVGRLRRSLREQPRNAVRWANLARLRTITGNPDHARSAMRIGLALAPSDRYVLRSAARLSIHRHESDRAHQILARSPQTTQDPWLLAAEISSAAVADRRSRNIRRARSMLASDQYSARSMTELASVLGTLELKAGDDRAARRLFRQALEEPTENSLAQANWASERIQSFEVDAQGFDIPRRWEALAITASRRGDWKAAVSQARCWQDDQPFASRPAEFGSYEASMGGDFLAGVQFAERGLTANPGEFLLLDNLAFCHLSRNEIDRATRYLDMISPEALSARERSTYLATCGLLEYRRGNVEEGRSLYSRAISNTRNPRQRALGAIMLAREELLASAPGADAAVTTAKRLLAKTETKDLETWLEQWNAKRWRPRVTSPNLSRTSASVSRSQSA